MSKKSPIQVFNTGSTQNVEFSPPQLFSRRVSKGGPFVISESDNPYGRRQSQAHGLRSGGRARSSSLVGLGIDSRSAGREGKRPRNRQYLYLGLAAAALFLVVCATSSSRYLPPAVRTSSSFSPLAWTRRAGSQTRATSQGGTDEGQHGLHTFHPNGLLLVNPKGRHPIHVLIENAEKKWRALLKKQSTTLDDAVQEYKRRYKRNPPKGFDSWWNYAKQNKVQLVDEYDQVSRDFEPFWALEPADLLHRNKVMQDRDHTFTLSIRNGRVTRHGKHAELQRAQDMANLIAKFSKFVPGEVNMTFVIDDNPAVMMGYNQKERMLELAKQGEYWGPGEFAPAEDATLSNFAKACPPSSALRRAEEGGAVSKYGSSEGGRSFIHDHAKAVDICSHPEFSQLHGHTAQGGIPLTPLVPLFTWAKTGLQNDILVTPLEQYDDDYLVYDPPFEEKPRNKLMWRGSTTGSEFRTGYPWEQSQRARLHFMGAEKSGQSEVLWSDHGAMRLSNSSTKDVNAAYMDVRFSGVPAQCDPETCERMSKIIDFAPTMGLEQQNGYRYLMDVDGNGWSGRFHRLLSTNAVVLKSTVFPEWYQDRIVPWVHYVPVKVDYSDLYDIMGFFIGTPDGEGSHAAMAQRIGEAGKEFAKTMWRREDMAAYMFRLVLEYARLLHQDSSEYVDYYADKY